MKIHLSDDLKRKLFNIVIFFSAVVVLYFVWQINYYIGEFIASKLDIIGDIEYAPLDDFEIIAYPIIGFISLVITFIIILLIYNFIIYLIDNITIERG